MCSEIRGGDDFGADIGIGFFSEINKLIVCTPKGNADSFINIGTTLESPVLKCVECSTFRQDGNIKFTRPKNHAMGIIIFVHSHENSIRRSGDLCHCIYDTAVVFLIFPCG